MLRITHFKERWYFIVGFLLILTLLFSINLPAMGQPISQEGISQPQAFTSGGTINFQGQLTDQGGNPLDGSYNMRFSIYDGSNVKQWPSGDFEHHSEVLVSNGLFSVKLGSQGTAITPSVFDSGGDRFLNVYVCKTDGAGCSDYDFMGSLEISSSAIAQSLQSPVRLENNTTDPVLWVENSGSGIGAQVFSYGEYGVHARSTATEGVGVYGQGFYGVFGKGSGLGVGVYGEGMNGVYGKTNRSAGKGVHGFAGAFSGPTYGVYGESASDEGTGVYGVATAESGSTFGVYGEASSSNGGKGVYGIATATDGYAYGVYGETNTQNGGAGVYGWGASTGNSSGVYGFTPSKDGYGGRFVNNAGGVAGYFGGDVTVTGNISKNSSSFKIDHPLDPENKYLYHSVVESPDMKNIYDGVVVLDENGEVLVTMPEWFEALNQEFRYQLTAIGEAMPNLYVSQKIEGNTFGIAGGVPGMEVSWQVTGIRHDPYAVENRIPIEEAKTQDEIGTFLYPQGYGLSEEFGVNYDPDLMPELDMPSFTD